MEPSQKNISIGKQMLIWEKSDKRFKLRLKITLFFSPSDKRKVILILQEKKSI